MSTEMICIICPNGCLMTVDRNNDEISVTGNACLRGINYAKSEMINPLRNVASTATVINGTINVVPVCTVDMIPKNKIFEVMEIIRNIKLNAPLYAGDIVYDNAGIKIMVTCNVERRN